MAECNTAQSIVDECVQDLSALQLSESLQEHAPRASFMGLPVELRLLIYALLAGSFTIRTTKSRHLGTHMCARPTPCCGLPNSDLSILAVNQQISVEAGPIIYQILELSPGNPFIPQSVSKHVRNLFVLCDSLEEGWYYDQLSGQPAYLSDLWWRVKREFPKVQQVRLRVDHAIRGSVHRAYVYGGRDISSPGNITEISGLRSIIVESYISGGGRKSNRARLLFDFIKEDVECEGLKVEVLERFLTRS